MIAIHSFTPVYLGKSRPWEIGVVFGDDRRLADDFIRGLKADPALTVGINQPYAPADQVYYTVERHAGPRGLPAAMIEIRNDEISDAGSQRSWAIGWPGFSCKARSGARKGPRRDINLADRRVPATNRGFENG